MKMLIKSCFKRFNVDFKIKKYDHYLLKNFKK